ncbi:MAG: MurR/RpiR family transcriptional regulator [Erysipelotrichaceae bacterium]|nr:MurR/RpiR family transcriptional regulator [Erysipelotrichaceae bacterium]
MIIEQFNHLESYRDTEKSIILYLINNIDHLEDLTITSLALETYTSNATVIRFCRKLGFDGFRDFKIQLIKEAELQSKSIAVNPNTPFLSSDSLPSVGNKIATLISNTLAKTEQNLNYDQIEKAAQMIIKCKRTFMFARGDTFNTCSSFVLKMNKVNEYPILANQWENSAQSLTNLTTNDCAVFVTYSGRNSNFLHFAEYLKELKIPTIVITGNIKSKLVKLCDVAIMVPMEENFDEKIGVFSSQVSIELVLDIIYSAIFKHNYQANLNKQIIFRKTISKALREDEK